MITHSVAPICAWFVENGLSQDTARVSVELINTHRLAVKADLLIEECVSA